MSSQVVTSCDQCHSIIHLDQDTGRVNLAGILTQHRTDSDTTTASNPTELDFCNDGCLFNYIKATRKELER
jgi:hypothetical protein